MKIDKIKRNESILDIHLWELKSRMAYIFFSFFCTFASCYIKAIQLTHVFLLSFAVVGNKEKSFIFTDVYEAFSSTIRICFVSTLFLILPLFLYNCLCFVTPSWYLSERKRQLKYILIVWCSWLGYMFFVHTFFIPKLCTFLLKFQVEKECLNIVIEPKIFSYVSWATNLFLVAIILFLLICAMYICVHSGVFNLENWCKYRKICILICLLFASFISPPDFWSQALISITMFIFCELVVWSSFVRTYLYNYTT